MAVFKGLPSVIKVGHRDYRVELVDHWRSTDTGTFGRCDSNAGLIELDEHMDRFKAVETVLHELVHAGWYVFNQPKEKLKEEDVCEGAGRIMAAVFRDNPALVKWIGSSVGD